MAARILNGKDYSEGTTKIVLLLEELNEDKYNLRRAASGHTPSMSRLVFNYIISPLQKKGILNFRYVKWDEDSGPSDEPTDSQFRLVALILMGHKHVSRGSWSDVTKWYAEDVKWKGVFASKLEQLKDKDKIFAEITEDLGEEAAKVIVPLLKEGN